jgi:hypothetical protein
MTEDPQLDKSDPVLHAITSDSRRVWSRNKHRQGQEQAQRSDMRSLQHNDAAVWTHVISVRLSSLWQRMRWIILIWGLLLHMENLSTQLCHLLIILDFLYSTSLGCFSTIFKCNLHLNAKSELHTSYKILEKWLDSLYITFMFLPHFHPQRGCVSSGCQTAVKTHYR